MNVTAYDPDLAPWEAELLSNGTHTVGEGDVVFTLNDGSTLTVINARVDSVGPSAEHPGVVGVEFRTSDAVLHVPFVRYWTFNYR